MNLASKICLPPTGLFLSSQFPLELLHPGLSKGTSEQDIVFNEEHS